MKLQEVLPEQQLDEKTLRHALAAGILGTSMAMPGAISSHPPPEQQEPKPRDEIVVTAKRPTAPTKHELDIPAPTFAERTKLTKNIAEKYRVSEELVQKVVNLAFKYQDPEFPKAKDILAIIGIESSFDPSSKSGLKKDPALGLMQVRPGVWNIDPDDLINVESQIKYGVDILKHYYKKLGHTEDTIQAYNLGITKFRKGARNPRYVSKFQRLISRFN